jgi:putative (di)nucleoside polyphosphate hydrolase
MADSRQKPRDYRPCVGVAVFNADGKIWLGKRFGQDGPYNWQMPQGGIDKGETPEIAAARELFEETGIALDMVTPIGEVKDWLYYDFPPEYRGKKATKGWAGQRQRWFAFRFHGKPSDIDLQSHGPREFSEWRWGDLAETPELIVPFKRKVYERLASEFERFSHPIT